MIAKKVLEGNSDLETSAIVTCQLVRLADEANLVEWPDDQHHGRAAK